jgi:hypothetical protein
MLDAVTGGGAADKRRRRAREVVLTEAYPESAYNLPPSGESTAGGCSGAKAAAKTGCARAWGANAARCAGLPPLLSPGAPLPTLNGAGRYRLARPSRLPGCGSGHARSAQTRCSAYRLPLTRAPPGGRGAMKAQFTAAATCRRTRHTLIMLPTARPSWLLPQPSAPLCQPWLHPACCELSAALCPLRPAPHQPLAS